MKNETFFISFSILKNYILTYPNTKIKMKNETFFISFSIIQNYFFIFKFTKVKSNFE